MDKFTIILIIGLSLFLLGLIGYELKFQIKHLKNLKSYNEQQEREFRQRQEERDRLETEIRLYQKEIAKTGQFLQTMEEDLQAARDVVEKYKENGIKEIDRYLLEKYEAKEKLKQYEYDKFLATLDKEAQEYIAKKEEVQKELNELQKKQNAINEEILRRRELEEKHDFYRVCIPEENLSDIKLLSEVKQKLKKSDFLNKIIYESYVSKPVLEMIKRVLQNSTCCGIYKITCIPTQEIYIGKSTDIKARWTQHCKTAFDCGTIASSLLHQKMKQYGIENFTFELLEKTSKEQLSEREKYYIEFYKTKEVGLNERKG